MVCPPSCGDDHDTDADGDGEDGAGDDYYDDDEGCAFQLFMCQIVGCSIISSFACFLVASNKVVWFERCYYPFNILKSMPPPYCQKAPLHSAIHLKSFNLHSFLLVSCHCPTMHLLEHSISNPCIHTHTQLMWEAP